MVPVIKPEPSQRGNLAKTPLAHLLVYAHDRQLTGTLDIIVPDARSTLVLAAGKPTKARVHLPVPYLGRVLLERGAINEQQLDATLLDLAKTRRLHGRILLERGLITPQALRDGLRDQLLRKLDVLYELPPESTSFEYFAEYDGLADYGGAEEIAVDPFASVWRGVSRAPSWDHVQATLAHLGVARIRIAKSASLERLELGREELKLVEIIRAKPMTLYEILSTELLPPKRTQLLVYTLAITKQVGLVVSDTRPEDSTGNFSPVEVPPPPSSSSVRNAPPEPPSVSAAPPSPPATQVARVSLRKTLSGGVIEEIAAKKVDQRVSEPPPPSPSPVRPAKQTLTRPAEPAPAPPAPAPPAPAPAEIVTAEKKLDPALAARRAAIIARAETIDKQNYFEMLEVPRDASPDVIRNSYFQLARMWHPDRLPAELADVKAACAKVFARLSEANQTLADEKKRKQYEQQIGAGSGSPEEEAQVQAVLEAALCFQKAEICFKRNDLAQAEQLARRALELDATQADYHALIAWFEALKNTSVEATAARIAELDKALTLNPKCERALFYRAQLYKRAGNEALALKDFKTAFELNPRNLDAQREVRLLEMRKGDKKEKEEDKGGLFSRLFKK